MKLTSGPGKREPRRVESPDAAGAAPGAGHDERRSPALRLPGAVEGSGPDAGVPAHYGRPARETWALEAGEAVADLSHLDVVAVSGRDRLTWLHSLTTQHLSALAPGVCTETLVLDPHGHVEHAATVVDDLERTWMFTEPARDEAGAARGSLADFLDSMRFAMRVEVERRDDLAVLGHTEDPASGPGEETSRAGLALAELLTERGAPGAPVWRDPWPGVVDGSTTYGATLDHPGAARRAVLRAVPRADVGDLLEALAARDVTAAGLLAWESLRVAAWRPRVAREADARALPHELDWLRTAVHLTKGCYRGQETVARVVNLGRPPRRLVLLHLDGSAEHLPDPGAPVVQGTRAVGTVTSAVRHADLGPVALALVRRAVDPAAALEVDGVAAAQEVVVNPTGEPAARPAQRDLSGLRRRDLR